MFTYSHHTIDLNRYQDGRIAVGLFIYDPKGWLTVIDLMSFKGGEWLHKDGVFPAFWLHDQGVHAQTGQLISFKHDVTFTVFNGSVHRVDMALGPDEDYGIGCRELFPLHVECRGRERSLRSNLLAGDLWFFMEHVVNTEEDRGLLFYDELGYQEADVYISHDECNAIADTICAFINQLYMQGTVEFPFHPTATDPNAVRIDGIPL